MSTYAIEHVLMYGNEYCSINLIVTHLCYSLFLADRMSDNLQYMIIMYNYNRRKREIKNLNAE